MNGNHDWGVDDKFLVNLTDNSENDKNDGPLGCLRPSTVESLARLLNPLKIIPCEHGMLRDWRGVAEFAGLSAETIMYLEHRDNPTAELIKTWAKEGRKVGDLKAGLAVVDRFDTLDDVGESFENDVKIYWEQKDRIANGVPVEPLALEDSNMLTVGNSRYDAFILYAEEDSDFAHQVIEKMEGEYGLKMCVKDRDLLAGTMFEHETISTVIEQRCNRLVIIFSPDFLKSPANQFLVSYTQALALETRQRKIIPCMYQQCELPPSVRYSFCLDYRRSGKLWNFWDKLGQSLGNQSAAVPIAAQRKTSDLAYSSSLPARSGFASPKADLENASWWDPQKPRHHSSYSTSDSGVVADIPDDFDVMSMQSSSGLVPSAKSQKNGSSKWYKRFMNPTKKKTSKKKEAEAIPS